MGKKIKKRIVIIFTVFCVLVLTLVTGLTSKSSKESRDLLIESIEKELIAVSIAARELIDVDFFCELRRESLEDEEILQRYNQTLYSLRYLANEVDAAYIYALKRGALGSAYFVFDTDAVDDTKFTEYELSPVHVAAFAGKNAAGVMNVGDQWGDFNTGAVPILTKDLQVVGIVCVDLLDNTLASNIANTRINALVMIGLLTLFLAFFGVLLFYILAKLDRFQKNLDRLAYFDSTTNLPNRSYLLSCLDGLVDAQKKSFALYFIDMDNFKAVNDNAGHDAGDELLRRVGEYLQKIGGNTGVFRVGSGSSNVAARFGGDEFILIVPEIQTEEEAASFARTILNGFKGEGIDHYAQKYNVGLSIGVALYPHHSQNYNVLIKYADIAMYNAKRNGKNNYSIYSETLHRN